MFSPFEIALAGVIGCLVYATLHAAYNILLHPLRKFPGPKLRAAFHFPHYWEYFTGETIHNWHKMHEQYGEIIRVAPNQLSIVKADAWKDIYGSPTKKPIPKDPDFYLDGQSASNILVPDDAEHQRFRRLLNPAFSEAATRANQDVVNDYLGILIDKLREKAEAKEPVDMTAYINWTTFDIVGELCFSESFDALKKEQQHEWIESILPSLKVMRIYRAARAYWYIGMPVLYLVSFLPWWKRWWTEVIARQGRFSHEKLGGRRARKPKRRDYMSHFLQENNTLHPKITESELQSNTIILVIAGSETTASFLTATLFYLCTNPLWMSNLHNELRSTFTQESDITYISTMHLRILNAIANESFRMYPPVPSAMPRRTSAQGAVVCGHFIPPNVCVSMSNFPVGHSRWNWKDAGVFSPQRWLGDGEFVGDKRAALQPFSVGPRNCIGRSLAWAELRVFMARLVWNFEFELLEESQNWAHHQKTFQSPVKPSMMIKITDRLSR